MVTNISFGGGGSFQQVHLDSVQCTGTEPNLLNCSHNGIGVHDCEHPEDIGIICERPQGTTNEWVVTHFDSLNSVYAMAVRYAQMVL